MICKGDRKYCYLKIIGREKNFKKGQNWHSYFFKICLYCFIHSSDLFALLILRGIQISIKQFCSQTTNFNNEKKLHLRYHFRFKIYLQRLQDKCSKRGLYIANFLIILKTGNICSSYPDFTEFWLENTRNNFLRKWRSHFKNDIHEKASTVWHEVYSILIRRQNTILNNKSFHFLHKK